MTIRVDGFYLISFLSFIKIIHLKVNLALSVDALWEREKTLARPLVNRY